MAPLDIWDVWEAKEFPGGVKRATRPVVYSAELNSWLAVKEAANHVTNSSSGSACFHRARRRKRPPAKCTHDGERRADKKNRADEVEHRIPRPQRPHNKIVAAMKQDRDQQAAMRAVVQPGIDDCHAYYNESPPQPERESPAGKLRIENESGQVPENPGKAHQQAGRQGAGLGLEFWQHEPPPPHLFTQPDRKDEEDPGGYRV